MTIRSIPPHSSLDWFKKSFPGPGYLRVPPPARGGRRGPPQTATRPDDGAPVETALRSRAVDAARILHPDCGQLRQRAASPRAQLSLDPAHPRCRECGARRGQRADRENPIFNHGFGRAAFPGQCRERGGASSVCRRQRARPPRGRHRAAPAGSAVPQRASQRPPRGPSCNRFDRDVHCTIMRRI